MSISYDSLVGKTLKGISDGTTRYDILIKNQAGMKEKSEFIDCNDGIPTFVFKSILCSSKDNVDYSVDYTLNLNGKATTIPCIASVDKNMNINLVTYGRFDITLNLPTLPIPITLPTVLENVLINLQFNLNPKCKKCKKGKYDASGKVFLSVILNVGNQVEIEGNVVYLIKSSDLKFV